MSKPDRKTQIVEAALALLADHRVEAVTTRAVAKRVGITQPGLFRHFRSRDAIFVAVIGRVRGGLAEQATQVLTTQQGLDRAEALGAALVEQVEATPGIVRLLVRALDFPDEQAHAALSALVDTMRALAAQVVAESAPEVDSTAAGAAFVALVQGTMLQWQLAGRPPDLDHRMRAALALWRAGIEAGEPAGRPVEPVEVVRLPVRSLDARPILAGGTDPLQAILAELEGLDDDGILVLRTPFRPAPLLALLGSKGYRVVVDGERDCELYVSAPGAGELLDYRELEAPEPLERVLVAVETLDVGGSLVARVPRVPQLLLDRLAERDVVATALATRDAGLVHVRRP